MSFFIRLLAEPPEASKLRAGGIAWVMCALIDLLEICLPRTSIIITENRLEAVAYKLQPPP